MGKAPDEIRAEIERTRAELSSDVDVLADKVSPSRVVERRVDATKQAVTGLKDKVMGTAGDVGSAVSAKASTVSGAVGDRTSGVAGGVSSTASSAPQQLKSRAQGNPLAAGLVVFGLGWLASSVFPATAAEQRAAETLKEKAEPLKSELTSVAQEIKGNLQQPVQEAVASVKETAADAAGTVKETAADSAVEVKEHATAATATVKDQASESAATVKGTASDSAAAVKETASSATGPAGSPAVPAAPVPAANDEEIIVVPPSPYSTGGTSA